MTFIRTSSFCVVVLLAFLTAALDASAQALEARVSVKVILDEDGHRPVGGWFDDDAQLQGAIDSANEILAANGAEWRFDLHEVRELSGLSQWWGPLDCVQARNSIEAAALQEPSLYRWRTDAINVYLTNELIGCGGVCSFPGGHSIVVFNNQGGEVYQGFFPGGYDEKSRLVKGHLFVHEIGHYFNLCHTQGCGTGFACVGQNPENPRPVANDEVDDTLPDLECWSPDDLATSSFGATYAELVPEQQDAVDGTFFNAMSYHYTEKFTQGKVILTADQLERMAREMDPITGRRMEVLNLPRPAFTVTPDDVEESEEIQVDARASRPGDDEHSLVSYEWDFGDGETSDGEAAVHTYTTPGSYRIRLTVTDDRGLWMITEETITVRLSGEVLPPWTAQDIGAVTGLGGARSEDGCVLVQGSVGTVSGSSDRFHYVAQPVEGNFSVTARIASWQNVSTRFAKVGLMVRESLNEDARHGAVFLEQPTFSTGTFRHRFLHRSEVGGSTGSVNHDSYDSPELWLRIDRIGETIQGFVSTNGSSWGEPDTVELPGLAAEVHVGIAASGQPSVGLWSVATICNLSIARPHFLRGDCNGDGAFDISDGTHNLNSLFGDGKPSNCTEACNANDDAQNDVSDAVYVFNFLFGSGAPPAAPYPACGEDPEPAASLGCGRFGCE